MPVEILYRYQFPYSAVVHIEVTFPNGKMGRGTGAVVGRNDILTATHVLYSPADGGWAAHIALYPAADYNGLWQRYDDPGLDYLIPAHYNWRSLGWPEKVFVDGRHDLLTGRESEYDIAILGLSFPLGDLTGWFGLAAGYDHPQWAHAIGYPDGGTGMMLATSWVSKPWGYELYENSTRNYGETLGPGSSGGPLYVIDQGQHYIIGVMSSGTRWGNTWADIGHLYDPILQAMRDNDALLTQAANARGLTLYGTAGSNNLQGGMGPDQLFGGSGNDTLTGAQGDDVLDGGAGIDLAIYTGVRSQYTLKPTLQGWQLRDHIPERDGLDTLINVERLAFADRKLALDLGPHDNAGQAVLFIGVLAPQYLGSPAAVGAVLSYFDAGYSMLALMQLAVGSGLVHELAGGGSHADVVRLAYSNITGLTATPDVVDWLTSYMDGRQARLTQAEMLSLFAELELTQQRVDLVGLAATGIEYL